MTHKGIVEISGTDDRYTLVQLDGTEWGGVWTDQLSDGKMILIVPGPSAYWALVKNNQIFAFAEGYEAIIGVGLYNYESHVMMITVYDEATLRENLSTASRESGEDGQDTGDDYAASLMDSIRRQGHPTTNDCVGLRIIV